MYRGPRSGRTYQTPVNTFPTENGYIIALTFGAENTDWVKTGTQLNKLTVQWQASRFIEIMHVKMALAQERQGLQYSALP